MLENIIKGAKTFFFEKSHTPTAESIILSEDIPHLIQNQWSLEVEQSLANILYNNRFIKEREDPALINWSQLEEKIQEKLKDLFCINSKCQDCTEMTSSRVHMANNKFP